MGIDRQEQGKNIRKDGSRMREGSEGEGGWEKLRKMEENEYA